mmetsp:Transcript_9491/g.9020  ORF Transcript_9491/g.9020 Transcript_9491/m.9020 type:complete len:215 (-) Transcript_9491:5981-6625(-)
MLRFSIRSLNQQRQHLGLELVADAGDEVSVETTVVASSFSLEVDLENALICLVDAEALDFVVVFLLDLGNHLAYHAHGAFMVNLPCIGKGQGLPPSNVQVHLRALSESLDLFADEFVLEEARELLDELPPLDDQGVIDLALHLPLRELLIQLHPIRVVLTHYKEDGSDLGIVGVVQEGHGLHNLLQRFFKVCFVISEEVLDVLFFVGEEVFDAA